MMKYILIITIILSGCILKGPKYTRVEKVLKIDLGMTQSEVNTTLGLTPYDLVQIDSVGNKTLLYKYRVTDRRTLPMFLKDTNGKEIRSKFNDLLCTYNHQNVLIKVSTQMSDSEIKEHRLDVNTVLTFFTVTIPAVMVYLGLTAP